MVSALFVLIFSPFHPSVQLPDDEYHGVTRDLSSRPWKTRNPDRFTTLPCPANLEFLHNSLSSLFFASASLSIFSFPRTLFFNMKFSLAVVAAFAGLVSAAPAPAKK